jgi:hypothetical protein
MREGDGCLPVTCFLRHGYRCQVRGLMRDNIDSVLINADKLQDLSSKADNLAGISQGFYGSSRAARRSAQWEVRDTAGVRTVR